MYLPYIYSHQYLYINTFNNCVFKLRLLKQYYSKRHNIKHKYHFLETILNQMYSKSR